MLRKFLAARKNLNFVGFSQKTNQLKKVVIYATLPVGKVVGEFEIAELISESPIHLWERTAEFSGISADFFEAYFEGKDIAHAIKVGKVKKYNRQKDLADILPNGIAPQSFCYI